MNRKKVLRLMSRMEQHSKVRKCRKYSSYKGTIGKIATNITNSDFNANTPNPKWYTDVTEFVLDREKHYVSQIIDGNNGEIVAVDISKSQDMKQTHRILNLAFKKLDSLKGLIIHRD